MSLQSELAKKITEKYSDAVVKKIDKDNFLDIHLPSVNEKKGTHLFFNTSGGKIKLGFYCRDEEFIQKTLKNNGNGINIETYSQGLRAVNNPEFNNVDDAIASADSLISNLLNISPSIKKESISFNEALEAYQAGNLDILNKYIDQGNPMLQFNEEHLIKVELIYYVSAFDELDLRIENLVSKGVNLDETTSGDGCGYTAIHFAAWDNKIDILEYLLKEGANPDFVATEDGLTPLYLACVSGNRESVITLLKYKANPNILINGSGIEGLKGFYNEQGGTALRAALVNFHFDIALLLLENGSDISELLLPCSNSSLLSNFIEVIAELGLKYKESFNVQKFLEFNQRIEAIISVNNQSSDLSKEEKRKDNDELRYPVLSFKDTEVNRKYISKYLIPTKVLNGRIGVNIIIPDWVNELLDESVCYSFSKEDVDIINKGIIDNKVIPILDYSFHFNKSNLSEIKQLWWIMPFVFYKNDTISWLAVNKDGFYAPIHDNNDVSLVLSWDNVEDISFDTTYEDLYDDVSDSTMNLMKVEIVGGGVLSISEFMKEDRGSYLSVLHSIYKVRKQTIEDSRGLPNWKEGAGGEGFRGFPESVELNYLPYWSDGEVFRP
jgi:hypothetical protein